MNYIATRIYSSALIAGMAIAGCGSNQPPATEARDVEPNPAAGVTSVYRPSLEERGRTYIEFRQMIAAELRGEDTAVRLISPGLRLKIIGCVEEMAKRAHLSGIRMTHKFADELTDICISLSFPPP